MRVEDRQIEDELLRHVTKRGPGKSICPSEVARALAADWRPLLAQIRKVAATLAATGQIEILRKGKPVASDEIKGVVRLRLRRPS